MTPASAHKLLCVLCPCVCNSNNIDSKTPMTHVISHTHQQTPRHPCTVHRTQNKYITHHPHTIYTLPTHLMKPCSDVPPREPLKLLACLQQQTPIRNAHRHTLSLPRPRKQTWKPEGIGGAGDIYACISSSSVTHHYSPPHIYFHHP